MSVNDDPTKPPLISTLHAEAAASTLKTAWAFGPYRKGMGGENSHPRERYAVEAIKKELFFHGYDDINLLTTNFGGNVHAAVKDLQKENGLVVDGLVGPKTINALWRTKIQMLQEEYDIPNDWLRALIHWESLDDPGARNPAEGLYSDGSVDNGLAMLNSIHKPLTEDEAFTPSIALGYAARYLAGQRDRFQGECTDTAPNAIVLAVASWRTPVGANDWCRLGDKVEPAAEGTWAQRAAHYVSKVDTSGRAGWIG